MSGQAAGASSNARSMHDLLLLLEENIRFLQRSSAGFDSGFEGEAKRLAVVLRVLLHDTDRSTSLMQQLGAKEQIRYTDTAVCVDDRNRAPTAGLAMIRGGVEGPTFVAPLGDLIPPRIRPPALFGPWWNDLVAAEAGRTWSRSDYVKMLANREGGAHVDPSLNIDYERIARIDGVQRILSGPTIKLSGVSGNLASVSVRQIAYELLDTYVRERSAIAGAS